MPNIAQNTHADWTIGPLPRPAAFLKRKPSKPKIAWRVDRDIPLSRGTRGPMIRAHVSELTKIAGLLSITRRRLLDDGLHDAAKLIRNAARQVHKAQQVLDPRQGVRDSSEQEPAVAASGWADVDFDAIPQPIAKARRAARRAHKFTSTKTLDEQQPVLAINIPEEPPLGDVLARWRATILETLIEQAGDTDLVNQILDRTVRRARPFLDTFTTSTDEDLFRWLTRLARRDLQAAITPDGIAN